MSTEFSMGFKCDCGNIIETSINRKPVDIVCKCGKKYRFAIESDKGKSVGKRGPFARYIRGTATQVIV